MSSPNRSDGLLPGDTMLKTLEAYWCVLLLNGLCAISLRRAHRDAILTQGHDANGKDCPDRCG